MNLADNLKNSAERFPDRPAVVFYDRVIRYEQLYADALRFAGALGEMGMSRGDRMAIAIPNVPEYPVALYGAFAAGVEVVTINPLYSAREIEYMLKDGGVKLAIMHPMFEPPVREAAANAGTKLLYSDSMGDPAKRDMKKAMSEAAFAPAPADLDPNHTAAIIYTNAWRGYPLGACLTHLGLMTNARSSVVTASAHEDDAFLTVIPLFHAFACTTCLHLPFLAGAKTVLHEMFSEDRVMADLKKEKISVFPNVPTINKRLLDKFGSAGSDLSFVRAIVPGGAPLTDDLYGGLVEKLNANVYQGYGITECGPVTSVNPMRGREFVKAGSVGPPIEGITVKVVDENGEALSTGETGELCVRGGNVMREYLGKPEDTAMFLKDGWLFSGDLASIDEDGYIYITGHKKRLVLVGGFNVYPQEVEALLGAHPAVESCRVFGVPDDSLGERVMAEAKLRSGASAEPGELRKFLRSALAPYKVPRRVDIIE